VAFDVIRNRLGVGISGRLSAKNIENRRARRRGYNNSAWIRLEDSFGIRRCQLLDISRTGVRLAMADPDKIPKTFILLLSKNSAGYRARVKWRRGTQIGAEFQQELGVDDR
jgi:PilZ domain